MSHVRFLDAVYLNARGVRFLQKGLYQNAKASFAKAISLAGGKIDDTNLQSRLPKDHPLREMQASNEFHQRGQPQQQKDTNTGPTTNSSLPCTRSPSSTHHTQQQPQQQPQQRQQQNATNNIDSTTFPTSIKGFVDDTPMIFSSASAVDQDQRRSRVKLCVVILYNYGLAYHLHSFERYQQGHAMMFPLSPSSQSSFTTRHHHHNHQYNHQHHRSHSNDTTSGNNNLYNNFHPHHLREEDLSRAVHMYELSCALSYQADLDMGWAYRLRVANNLGHTLRELGHVTNAKGYFQDLLSCLFYLQQEILNNSNDNTRQEDVLNQEEVLCGQYRIASLERFFENLTPMILKDAVVSAAA